MYIFNMIEEIKKSFKDVPKEDLGKKIEEDNKLFEDIFDKIKEKAKDFPSLDIFVDEYYDEPGYEFVKDIEFVEPMTGGEEHRWYIVGNSLYKIDINGKEYYFGATEVTTLKSESMDLDDTYWETEIFKVKQVVKTCWERE